MLNKFIAAGITFLAASTPAIAQGQIRDNFHALAAMSCNKQPWFYHDLIEQNTDMTILFESFNVLHLISPKDEEIEDNARMFFYVDSNTGTFAVTVTFLDGVTCLLTEGAGFEPYVE